MICETSNPRLSTFRTIFMTFPAIVVMTAIKAYRDCEIHNFLNSVCIEGSVIAVRRSRQPWLVQLYRDGERTMIHLSRLTDKTRNALLRLPHR
jgi:hypothetical protein